MNRGTSPRICAVTGARGYLGSVLSRTLEQRGWKVRELIRHEPSTHSNREFGCFNLGEEVDPALLRGTTALVHCAWDFQTRNIEESRKTNVEGTRKLFVAAHDAGVEKPLFVSSMAAFKGTRSVYGQGKLETETIAQDLGAVSIRPGLIFGKIPLGILGSLTRVISILPVIPLVAADSELYFCEDEFLANCIAKLLDLPIDQFKKYIGAPLTIANPKKRLFSEVVGEISQKAGRRPKTFKMRGRPVLLALGIAEHLGLKLPLRKDSLMGLLHFDRNPQFNEALKLFPGAPEWRAK